MLLFTLTHTYTNTYTHTHTHTQHTHSVYQGPDAQENTVEDGVNNERLHSAVGRDQRDALTMMMMIMMMMMLRLMMMMLMMIKTGYAGMIRERCRKLQ